MYNYVVKAPYNNNQQRRLTQQHSFICFIPRLICNVDPMLLLTKYVLTNKYSKSITISIRSGILCCNTGWVLTLCCTGTSFTSFCFHAACSPRTSTITISLVGYVKFVELHSLLPSERRVWCLELLLLWRCVVEYDFGEWLCSCFSAEKIIGSSQCKVLYAHSF